MKNKHEVEGLLGFSGGVNTFMGYAPANFLFRHSSADVLDEESGKGYQRRFNDKHSLDFRKYILSPGSTTIPLTFNLRPDRSEHWEISTECGGSTLVVNEGKRVFSQVDCQHRLGYLADLEISLPFITFIGLSQRQEMAIFNTINSKAKGLSGSLLDYHETELVADIEKVKPELVLAVRLNNDTQSPWFKMLDLGGSRTSGIQRRASLRTMQKALRVFHRNLQPQYQECNDELYTIVLSFWRAVVTILPEEWDNPRKFMLCKGIGVYSLMAVAADICQEKEELPHLDWYDFYRIKVGQFARLIDWSNQGPLKGLGGGAGVTEATNILRSLRGNSQLKAV